MSRDHEDDRHGPGRLPHSGSPALPPESTPMRMANKLCDLLGDPEASEEWDVPPKPKGMRWSTYERLTEKYVKYRKHAGILPWEYRYVGAVV